MMNIYIAGPIRAGLLPKSFMNALIGQAKSFGTVLTEHIFVLNGEEVRQKTSREIYDEDMKWLSKSDVVIAEISTPSLGVGYEIARALSMNKPVLCLCSKKVEKLSAMKEGNRHLRIYRYNDVPDVLERVSAFLAEQKKLSANKVDGAVAY